MSILRELYHGNVNPTERHIKKGSDYQKLADQLMKQQEKLKNRLDEEGVALFNGIEMRMLELSVLMEREYFVEGFRMGAQMMEDVHRYQSEVFD